MAYEVSDKTLLPQQCPTPPTHTQPRHTFQEHQMSSLSEVLSARKSQGACENGENILENLRDSKEN